MDATIMTCLMTHPACCMCVPSAPSRCRWPLPCWGSSLQLASGVAPLTAPPPALAHCCRLDPLSPAARFEFLNEDWAKVAAIINKRSRARQKQQPQLRLPKLPTQLVPRNLGPTIWVNTKQLGQPFVAEALRKSAHHAQKYAQCGAPCINGVAAFYEEDIAFFRYPRPPSTAAEAPAAASMPHPPAAAAAPHRRSHPPPAAAAEDYEEPEGPRRRSTS